MYHHLLVTLLFACALAPSYGADACPPEFGTLCPKKFVFPPALKDNATQVFRIGNMYNNAIDSNTLVAWGILNINNDPDILPGIRLELYSLPFSTQSQAIIGAIRMVSWANVTSIISNAEDEFVVPIHDICMAYNVPLFAIRAMDDAFEEKRTFTMLSRIFPTSAAFTEAMVALVNDLGYSGALLISTKNSHVTAASVTLTQQGTDSGMKNVKTVSVPSYPTQTDINLAVNQSMDYISQFALRPIIILTTTTTGGSILAALKNASVYGPDLFYMFSTDMSRYMLGGVFPNIAEIANGAFNIILRDGVGEEFAQMSQAWTTLNRTIFPGTASAPGSQWLAYDSPFVVANAVDMAIRNKGSYAAVNYQDILNVVQNVSFMGVSGHVSFNSRRDYIAANGFYFYQIYNYTARSFKAASLYSRGSFNISFPYVFYNLSSASPNPGYCQFCFYGTCNRNSQCICDQGYEGQYCESKIQITLRSSGDSTGLLKWVLPVVGVIVLLSLIAAFYFKKRREQLVKDLSLRQRSDIARNEIKLLDRIGRGASGAVYKALFRGTEVAAKSLLTSSTSSDTLEEFKMETAMMCALRHPNIVLFMGSCYDAQQKEMLLVMEFCSRGSLHDLLNDPKVILSYELLLHLACQSAQGISFLHESAPPIIHRDLKSHNILLDDKFTAKISDFGLTRFKDTNKKNATQRAESLGTVFWTAPEVLSGKQHTEKSDCYSFGIVLWEMFHRQDPYPMMDLVTVAMDVMNKGIRPVMNPNTPLEIQELIRDCWQQDPDRRPGFQVITNRLRALSMQHPMHTFATGHQSRIEAPTGVIFLVHTDITALHNLFDTMPRPTKKAFILHNHLVRTNMELYGGFEVRLKNRGFFIVFNNCASAVNWCIATQVALTHLSWPDEILQDPQASEVAEGGTVIWRGLRVRMSISMGAPESDIDNNTGRMTYFGPVANKAKSILRQVRQGSIVVDSSVMDHINNKKLPLIETIVCRVSDDALPDGEIMHEVLPNTLRMRQAYTANDSTLQVASMDENQEETVVTFLKETPAAAAAVAGTGAGAGSGKPAWIIPLKQLTMAESIGKGQVGDYYRALWGAGNKEVAVKVLVNQKLREDDFISLLSDVSMLSRIKHKNLLPVHGVCTRRGHISIITEYISMGSLKDLLARSTPLSIKQTLQIAHDIATGMLYLTTHPYQDLHIHDNFKSNNILITKDLEVKITDFGQTNIKDLARTMTSISSVAWTAPEILNGEPISVRSAVYSFGIIMWELASRKVPYDGEHPLKVVTKILNGYRPPIPECLSEYQSLMRSCWDESPEQRPTWHVIVSELSHMISTV